MVEPRRRAQALGLLAFTLLSACPERASRRPTPKGCTTAYEKCELESGVLGICDVVDCPPGAPEPCLQCRSQH